MSSRKAISRLNAQAEFDFVAGDARGERLALLDALPLETGKTLDGQRSVSVKAATARSVLRAIEAHTRRSNRCWASTMTIARETDLSERTVRRAVRRLEDVEYLVVTRQDGRALECRINWGEISVRTRLNRPKSASVTPQNDRGHFFVNPGHCDTDPGHCDTNPGHSVRRSVSKRKEASSPSIPQTHSVDRSTVVGASADEWAAVEELFVSLPADRLPTAWQAGLRSAQRASVDPDYVTRVLQHYVAAGDAYQPGALVQRLRRSHPSVAPEAGWPNPLPPQRPTTNSGPTPQQVVRNVEFRVVKEGRRRKASDEVIRQAIVDELKQMRLDPALSNWGLSTENHP